MSVNRIQSHRLVLRERLARLRVMTALAVKPDEWQARKRYVSTESLAKLIE